MEQKRGTAKPTANDRETRLKAALKANMGRRKAQAKARAAAQHADETGTDQPGEQKD